MLSVEAFTCALLAGSGLLALWVHARFPALAPESPRRIAAHVALALAVLYLGPAAAEALPAIVVVLGLVLPALAYAFLACIWVLRVAAGALGNSPR